MSIVADLGCCAAAKGLAGKRFLTAEAPVLPLAGCDSKGSCVCSYRKHADRRSGEDRRSTLPGEKSQWYHGHERRNRRGRRRDD